MGKVQRKPQSDQGLNEFAMNTNRTVEHIVELQGRQGSLNYRKMSKQDGTVGMLLRAHKNPIRSCKWTLTENDDADETEKLAREILNKCIFGGKTLDFHTLLGQILTMLEYGYSAFEIYYTVFPFENNNYLVPILEQRMQTSIEDIWPQRNTIRQITIEDGVKEFSMDDIVFFVLNQQGEDFRGESILRNAWVNWKDKSFAKAQKMMGLQRHAVGIPSMKIPAGTKITDPNYLAATVLLKSFTQHEDAYMITEDGWDFEVITTNFNAEQVQKAIDAENTEMALSVLAQFVLLGTQGKGGAYALSRDQSDFFLDGIQHVINLIEHTYNKHVITPFLQLNFGDRVDPERIKLRGLNLNKKAGEELATTMKAFEEGGFLHATTDDEISIRQSLDLPPLSPEQVTLMKEQEDEKLRNPPEESVSVNNPEDDNTSHLDENDNKKKAVKLAETRSVSRKASVKKLEKEMNDFMVAQLLLIKDKLIADIEATLNRGTIEIKGLNNITISFSQYTKGLERKLAGIAAESWGKAKRDANKAGIDVPTKLAEDIDPKNLKSKSMKQFVANESLSVSEQQAFAMKNRAILTASNGPLKGFSVTQTLANVDRVIDDLIKSNSISVSGSLLVVGTSNFGSNEFNKEIEDQLWGYLFNAVDDERISEICSFYSGKTYSVNSAELSIVTPPLHSNCRSFLEPIYKTKANPGKLDNVIAPPSIRERQNIL